jgi:DNA-binding MarR family transcriptional regulator
VGGRPSSKQESAPLWRELYDAVLEVHDQNIAVLTSRGLTGGEIKALLKMKPGDGSAMRALAAAWNSDASTATWLVDRLERKGLVERRAKPGDRRVRVAALTLRGEQELAAIHAQFNRPPVWWSELNGLELGSLATLSRKLRDQHAVAADA